MKIIKKVLKGICYVLLIPFIYILVSLILSEITLNGNIDKEPKQNIIYLNTNGVHLDIILPIKSLNDSFLLGIKHLPAENYLSFGWGDQNFYLNTPTWGDLTFKNAFGALFLNSESLIHVTRYEKRQNDWIVVALNDSELERLNTYILKTFKTTDGENKIHLKNQGYNQTDDFYKANGSYSCFKTCNSWVNTGFKQSGLKACLWTPFDFGLMRKYE